MPQGFLEKPSSVMIAQISGFEKPQYSRIGPQGFVDALINDEMTDDLQKALHDVQLQDITQRHYQEKFSSEFLAKKFDLNDSSEILRRTKLSVFQSENNEYAPYDFRYLKKLHDVNYALILDPSFCGLKRYYHGFIPIGSPHAQTIFKIYLVDLKDNKIVGYHNAFKEVSISGEWDTPPRFDNAIKAVEDSLIQALDNTHLYFFINSGN